MPEKMQYIPPLSDVDVHAPLIYMWEIRDAENQVIGRYVGKANGGEKRPTQHYSRNVNKLLQGLPYKKGKNYRRVHAALAAATKSGQTISLSYLCNVPDDQNIFEVERRYIREYGCDADDGIGLNGIGKSLNAALEMHVPPVLPRTSQESVPQVSEKPEHLDLEDFLECFQEKYPDQFDIKSGDGRYSFWLGKDRIFRAAQSGLHGKVQVKLAQSSRREGKNVVFDWDGTDKQIEAAIETEITIYKQASAGNQ